MHTFVLALWFLNDYGMTLDHKLRTRHAQMSVRIVIFFVILCGEYFFSLIKTVVFSSV